MWLRLTWLVITISTVLLESGEGKVVIEALQPKLVYLGIETETSQEILQDLKNVTLTKADGRSLLGCGQCLANLDIGDSGVLESPGWPESYPVDQSCLWLLHTDRDAEIHLVCKDIELEQCVEKNKSGHLSSWNDLLVISPTWEFTKSFVYCGDVTKRLGTIRHTSLCNKMALVFKTDSRGTRKGFSCTYSVQRTYPFNQGK